VAVEIKATNMPKFHGIEVAANDRETAKGLRKQYWPYLVCNCFASVPLIQKIQESSSLVDSCATFATPLVGS